MKLLFDLSYPVPIRVWQLIRKLSLQREDFFFYVSSVDPRNRYPERTILLPLQKKYLMPWGEQLWDVDVILTSKQATLYHLRACCEYPVGEHKIPVRLFLAFEDLPQLMAKACEAPGVKMSISDLIGYLAQEFEDKTLEYIRIWGRNHLGELTELVHRCPEDLNLTDYFRRKGFFQAFMGNVPTMMVMRLMALLSGYKDTNQTGLLRRA